jgi:putative transposase
MTSPSPLLYNTYYHIFNRGNNRENIFIQERNYGYFLDLYGKYITPIAETFAYCLLRNHFHILVRIKSQDEIVSGKDKLFLPSRQFSNFFNAYAKAINAAYGRTGSLFQHPFKRTPVTTSGQFWNVIAYIHQNPQKHKFVEDFRNWRWSSYGIILLEKPTNISRQAVLDWFGGNQNYLELHQKWVSDVEDKWFPEDID